MEVQDLVKHTEHAIQRAFDNTGKLSNDILYMRVDEWK